MIHQRVFVGEMGEECAFGGACAFDHFLGPQGRIACFFNHLPGCFEKAGAGLQGAFLNWFVHGLTLHKFRPWSNFSIDRGHFW